MLALSLSLILAFGACGKKQNSGTSSSPVAAPSITPADSPQDLAKAIGQAYLESLGKVVDLLKDKPEAASIKPQIVELKEATVQTLVALGHKKEALGAADREVVNAALRLQLGLTPKDMFSAFSQAQQFYFSKDIELANLISSFNIITQYADFDLLKKQTPAEAQRLGLK